MSVKPLLLLVELKGRANPPAFFMVRALRRMFLKAARARNRNP